MKRIYLTRWQVAWIAGVAFTAGSCASTGQIPAAIQQSSQTVTTAPRFKPTPEQIADSMMAHQRYQAAIEQYKQVSPASVETWNKMGVAYQMLFNNAEATHCYQMALKMDPKNGIAFNNIGSIYMGQKNYSAAQRSYRKAVKLSPHSALFRKNLGTALLADRKYKKGWQAYQEALAIDPQIFDNSGSVRVQNPSTVQDRGAMNFYMAKSCVKAGMAEKAIYYLRLALNEGFTTPKKIMADTEFTALYDNPDFQQMLAAQGVYLTKPPQHPAVQQ